MLAPKPSIAAKQPKSKKPRASHHGELVSSPGQSHHRDLIRSSDLSQRLVTSPGLSPPEVLIFSSDVSSSEPLSCSPSEALSILTFVTSLTTSSSDPLTLEAAKDSPDWPQWQQALQHEYASLRKHQVFGPLVTNLPA